jgi:hypothetical protein
MTLTSKPLFFAVKYITVKKLRKNDETEKTGALAVLSTFARFS